MANVPWHEEVVSFVLQLTSLLKDYEIASEHEHSNCLLIAHKKVILSCNDYLLCIAYPVQSCHKNKYSLL